MSNLFWESINTIIATTPYQMDVILTLLEKIEKQFPEQLSFIKNIGWWSTPGNIKFPLDRRCLEIVHKCTDIRRIIMGKGQNIINFTSDDFQLLRSLSKLELIEIDHIPLQSSIFLTPLKTYCSDKN